MKNILVVAPHPDDETLGCGGTLLKHLDAGDRVDWLIVTAMGRASGHSAKQRAARGREIAQVAKRYGFRRVFQLGFAAARLDVSPRAVLVQKIAAVFKAAGPEVVYLPFAGDAHSDHRLTFNAVVAATKWFRQKSLQRVLCYETPSETGFGLGEGADFRPNVFVDIEKQLARKLEIAGLYASELGEFPFPRSLKALEVLAAHRGSFSGTRAAEAFTLLREFR